MEHHADALIILHVRCGSSTLCSTNELAVQVSLSDFNSHTKNFS